MCTAGYIKSTRLFLPIFILLVQITQNASCLIVTAKLALTILCLSEQCNGGGTNSSGIIFSVACDFSPHRRGALVLCNFKALLIDGRKSFLRHWLIHFCTLWKWKHNSQLHHCKFLGFMISFWWYIWAYIIWAPPPLYYVVLEIGKGRFLAGLDWLIKF